MSRAEVVVVVPRLYVQDMNIASAPFTWGAPAPSALVGLMHALQRKLGATAPVEMVGAGLVAHELRPHTYEGSYQRRMTQMRPPAGKDRKTPGMVEEARANGEVSLVFGVTVEDPALLTADHPRWTGILAEVVDHLERMRLAGGTIWREWPGRRRAHNPFVTILPDDEDEDEAAERAVRHARRTLLPGFALVSRHDWLLERYDTLRKTRPDATLLEAWMDAGRVRWHWEADGDGTDGEWRSTRQKGDGWIVPIPVGYVGISPLYEPGEVMNARDPSIPFRFVEAAYSVGQWVSPHRLEALEHILWYPETDHQSGSYMCINNYEQY